MKIGIQGGKGSFSEEAAKTFAKNHGFENYEIILKWNRSLRFGLAVCTLKDKFKNVL